MFSTVHRPRGRAHRLRRRLDRYPAPQHRARWHGAQRRDDLAREHPIVAEVERLPEPRLILVSRDMDATLEPRLAGEVLAYANPADPFALHKAALVLRGVVPPAPIPRNRWLICCGNAAACA